MPTQHYMRFGTHPGLNVPDDTYHVGLSSNGVPGWAANEQARFQQKVSAFRIGKGNDIGVISEATSGTSGSWLMGSGANGQVTRGDGTAGNEGMLLGSTAAVETYFRNNSVVPATYLAEGDKISAFMRVANSDIDKMDVMLSLGATSDTPVAACDGGSAVSDIIAVWYDTSADVWKGSVNGNAGTQRDATLTSTGTITDGAYYGAGFYVKFGSSATTTQAHWVTQTAAGVNTITPFTANQLTAVYAILTSQPILYWQLGLKNAESGTNTVCIDYAMGEVDR